MCSTKVHSGSSAPWTPWYSEQGKSVPFSPRSFFNDNDKGKRMISDSPWEGEERILGMPSDPGYSVLRLKDIMELDLFG